MEPANASNKAVKWSVNPAGNGVTVPNGAVKADRKAKPGTCSITAKALDENGAEASFMVEVKKYNKTNIRTQDTRVNLYRINNGYGSSHHKVHSGPKRFCRSLEYYRQQRPRHCKGGKTGRLCLSGGNRKSRRNGERYRRHTGRHQ